MTMECPVGHSFTAICVQLTEILLMCPVNHNQSGIFFGISSGTSGCTRVARVLNQPLLAVH